MASEGKLSVFSDLKVIYKSKFNELRAGNKIVVSAIEYRSR